MANDISGNSWRLDTVPFTYPYELKIKQISWTDQANVGDQVILQTVAGKPILDSKAQQANFQQNFGELGWQPSLTITKLDSGVIIINPGANK